jgi:Xaa-Pro aminopeptidase
MFDDIINPIVSKQKELMQKEGLGALVAMSPEMVCYTLGTVVPTQSLIRERLAICITSSEGKQVAIVVNIEEELVKKKGLVEDVRIYNEFIEKPIKILSDVLKEMHLENKKIGIELDYLPFKHYSILKKEMPNTEFVDCSEYFLKLREVKTNEEIKLVREIGKAAEQAHNKVFQLIKPGMSEKDIGSIVISEIYSQVRAEPKEIIVASGERSSMLNAYATNRIIKNGDILRVDIIATKNGYYCDICRTSVVGKPSKKQLDIWKTIIEARNLILRNIKPGINSHDLYSVYNDFVTKRGLTPIDFVGHGLGLGLHEEPYIGKYGGAIFKPGMIMCIEPIHVVPGIMGFQVEDEILITENGYELLTGDLNSTKIPVIE